MTDVQNEPYWCYSLYYNPRYSQFTVILYFKNRRARLKSKRLVEVGREYRYKDHEEFDAQWTATQMLALHRKAKEKKHLANARSRGTRQASIPKRHYQEVIDHMNRRLAEDEEGN